MTGKRNRRAEKNKTTYTHNSSALMPYSRMDSSSKEKSSHSANNSGLKNLSSLMEIMDSSAKSPNRHHSHSSHHHQNLSRTILTRHPRHCYGRQYSRRNSNDHSEASTSHQKGTHLRNEKSSFKFASQFNIESGHHAESKEKASRRPEKIRPRSSEMDSACGICQKQLKRKPNILETTLSSSDVSVVAVLVCGHVFHADCLETRTKYEDRRDPPCPLCEGLLSLE